MSFPFPTSGFRKSISHPTRYTQNVVSIVSGNISTVNHSIGQSFMLSLFGGRQSQLLKRVYHSIGQSCMLFHYGRKQESNLCVIYQQSFALCSLHNFKQYHNYFNIFSIHNTSTKIMIIFILNSNSKNRSVSRLACRDSPLLYKHALDVHIINQLTKDKHLSADFILTRALDRKTPILIPKQFWQKIKRIR